MEKKRYLYRWREAYGTRWFTTPCEVIEELNKTLRIRLIGIGKNGMRPGTELKVHKKSVLNWIEDHKPVDDSWKDYTYFYD